MQVCFQNLGMVQISEVFESKNNLINSLGCGFFVVFLVWFGFLFVFTWLVF